MDDLRTGQPATRQPGEPRPVPAATAALAAASNRLEPEPLDLLQKLGKPRVIAGHSMVMEPPAHDGPQPSAYRAQRLVHPPPQLLFDLLQFGANAFGNRATMDGKRSLPRLPADVRESEEVERLRFAFAPPGSAFGRKTAELDQAGLAGM